MNKIAVVGDLDSIMGFQAVGIDTYEVTEESAGKTIHRLARQKYALIFVTEQAAKDAREAISRYQSVPYPAIIPIPGNAGTTGEGMANIKKNVEKAVGVDIFFDEQNKQ